MFNISLPEEVGSYEKLSIPTEKFIFVSTKRQLNHRLLLVAEEHVDTLVPAEIEEQAAHLTDFLRQALPKRVFQAMYQNIANEINAKRWEKRKKANEYNEKRRKERAAEGQPDISEIEEFDWKNEVPEGFDVPV